MYDSTTMFSLAVFVGVIMPTFLFVFFFVISQEKPWFMDKLGLEKSEISLLLVGSVVGVVLNVPLFVGESLFLGINVGGALIPIVLSAHLVCKNRPNLAFLGFSIVVVSIISYHITDYYPSLGIAALFPYYLLPGLASFALPRMFERDIRKCLATAYSAGTFGTLIGADIVRIPLIISDAGDGLLASIGGAGSMDLVFSAGLMAGSLVIISFPRRNWKETKRTGEKVEHIRPRLYLDKAWEMHRIGKYAMCVELCRRAVYTQIKHTSGKYKIHGEPEECLYRMGVLPYMKHDYAALHHLGITEEDSRTALTASTLLMKDVRGIEKNMYKNLGPRVLAFLIDLVLVSIITVVMAIPLLLHLSIRNFTLDTFLSTDGMVLAMTAMSIMWTVHIIYFTLFEWKLGKTPGKHLLNMRVADEQGERCGFMPVFSRNVLRVIDIAAVVSLITLVPYVILFGRSERKQRIGDFLSGTVVIKT